jgi:hypothetical protein
LNTVLSDETMFYILIIAGLLVFAYACHTFESRFFAKLGMLSVLGASYLTAFSLTASHGAGVGAVVTWFAFPWIEIIGRVRQLRFPLTTAMSHRYPPSRDSFPDLDAVSSEIESAGFKEIENTGWNWDETVNFMRLFYHEELRITAAANLAQQSEFAVSYISLTSRRADGSSWTSSNYPFSYTMRFGPDQRMHRCLEAQTFADLVTEHQAFLQRENCDPATIVAVESDQMTQHIESDMENQIRHNIQIGILEGTEQTDLYRYSWRGCWFLYCQIVRDVIFS